MAKVSPSDKAKLKGIMKDAMGQSQANRMKNLMGKKKPAAQTGKSKAMGAKYKPVGKK